MGGVGRDGSVRLISMAYVVARTVPAVSSKPFDLGDVGVSTPTTIPPTTP